MRYFNLPLAVVIGVCCLSIRPAFAQLAPNTEFQIVRIEPAFLDSPKLSVAGYNKKSAGRPSPWLEVEVTFDRAVVPKAEKYSGEVTINYFVLLKNENATEERKPTLLTGSVTHVMVPQEKALHSVMYVSPRSLAKLFDGKPPVNAQQALVDVGVTITGKDGLLAIATAKGSVKGDKGWWDNTQLYTATPGFLLNKNETPFAPLEWDYYEAIKPSAAR
jgi:hypothetical protein